MYASATLMQRLFSADIGMILHMSLAVIGDPDLD